MRKFYSLLFLLVLLPLAATAQTEIEISPTTGTCVRTGSSANNDVTTTGIYFSRWTSDAENPSLTLSTGANDMWLDTDLAHTHYCSGKTFTLTAQSGYVITGYSFDFDGYEGVALSTTRIAVSVTPAGRDEVAGSATQAVRVSVSGLETVSTSFKVETGGNILISNFKVQLEKAPTTLQPFVPTTLVNGGFAPGTHWYTMSVKSLSGQAYYESDSSIKLAGRNPLTQTDADLWCFVGDRANGYKVYNKKAGAGKVLVADTVAITEAAVPTFMAESDMQTQHTAVWVFDQSASQLSTEDGDVSVYMRPYTTTSSYAVNNFGGQGQLKFWSGRDIGSSVLFQLPPVLDYLVDLTEGALEGATWTSAYTDPALVVSGLTASGSQLSASQTVQLQAAEGFVISGYSFDSVDGVTVTPAHGSLSTASGTVSVTGLDANTTSFTLSAAATLQNFHVTVTKYVPEDMAHTVKVFDNASSSVPYRIPALAKKANGDLVLVVDYRYSKADIGNGPVDLRYKISTDNGRTWGSEQTNLGDGDASLTGNAWNYAFGDPSIVADVENPNELLVMAVGGHVGYFSSTYANPQHVVRFRSHDGGKTWTEGDSLTYQIYNLYKGSIVGDAVGIFLTSGRIMQSRYIKVGDYYRLYIAHPFRGSTGQADFVIYSDDFGETWQVLGHNAKGQRASTGSDESKCEELPDGSVVISSRIQGGGRCYNVFTYTDRAKGEGTWSTTATPSNMAGGVINACNGEILVVPAVRNSDGQPLYLALQSVPLSSVREKVGFFYKELATNADFNSGSAMAANWKKGLQVTNLDACYSTMVLMDNDSIGFVYEESGFNGGYDIIFKSLSIDTITGGLYSIVSEGVSRKPYLQPLIDASMGEVEVGTAVGQVKSTDALDAALAAWEKKEFPTNEDVETIVDAYNNLERVEIVPGEAYSLLNKGYFDAGSNTYLATDADNLVFTLSEAENQSFFEFVPTENEGEWLLLGLSDSLYAAQVPLSSVDIPVVAAVADAYPVTVTSETDGWSLVRGVNPKNATVNCLAARISGSFEGHVRSATSTSSGNTSPKWRIEPVREPTSIDRLTTARPGENAVYDLQGRRVSEAGKGVYIVNGRKVLK